MSQHYSKWNLNVGDSPYLESQLPQNYPLGPVLQACRAFRRLPPNLKRLAKLSNLWLKTHRPDCLAGIDRWYDSMGYELDPDGGRRLTDDEIDAQWGNPPDSPLAQRDIPVPDGGVADPNTREPPPAEKPDKENGPPEAQLRKDIASRGYKAVSETYGIPIGKLPKGVEMLPLRDLDPIAFVERKAAALKSQYFYRVPVDYVEGRSKEHDFLTEALKTADVYDDLGGLGKDIFDRAEKYAATVA